MYLHQEFVYVASLSSSPESLGREKSSSKAAPDLPVEKLSFVLISKFAPFKGISESPTGVRVSALLVQGHSWEKECVFSKIKSSNSEERISWSVS